MNPPVNTSPTSKTCSRCQTLKPIDEYYKYPRSNKLYIAPDCKQCHRQRTSIVQKRHHQRHTTQPERFLSQARLNQLNDDLRRGILSRAAIARKYGITAHNLYYHYRKRVHTPAPAPAP